MTTDRLQLVDQLRDVLPQLRRALVDRDPLGPVLLAHGLDRSLLRHLEGLGALDTFASTSRRWRRYHWSWQGTDAELVEKLLTLPAYAYGARLRKTISAKYQLAKAARTCYRCRRRISQGEPLLRIRLAHRSELLCLTCRLPSDEPLHEQELERLRDQLAHLHLLWPDELPRYAQQLAQLAELLAVQKLRARSPLRELRADLQQLSEWLTAADRKISVHRDRLLSQGVLDLNPEVPRYDLAEVVAEDPRALQLPAERQAAEAVLQRRAVQLERRRDADLVHQGLLHATSWLKDLGHRLTVRRLSLTL